MTNLPKQKHLKRSSLLLIILALAGITLSSCGPKKPPLTLCFFSSDRNAFLCTDPDGNDLQVEARDANKYFGLSPRDSEKLLDYVTDLEAKVAKCK